MGSEKPGPRKGPLRVGIVVASDRCAAGEAADRSGRLLYELCRDSGLKPGQPVIVPDDIESIKHALLELVDEQRVDVVLTSGGTGIGPRDVTPEATGSVVDREVPGIAEAIRRLSLDKVPAAMLSRGMAGIRKGALIVNLPGSPGGVKDGFRVILPILEHSRDMMAGKGHDDAAEAE